VGRIIYQNYVTPTINLLSLMRC